MYRFEELRKEKDLNQDEISACVGIDQSTYSKYINGKIQIPVDVVCNLADYYGTSVDYVLCLTDERKPYPKSIVSDEDE